MKKSFVFFLLGLEVLSVLVVLLVLIDYFFWGAGGGGEGGLYERKRSTKGTAQQRFRIIPLGDCF